MRTPSRCSRSTRVQIYKLLLFTASHFLETQKCAGVARLDDPGTPNCSHGRILIVNAAGQDFSIHAEGNVLEYYYLDGKYAFALVTFTPPSH